jgi:hypothetical protein
VRPYIRLLLDAENNVLPKICGAAPSNLSQGIAIDPVAREGLVGFLVRDARGGVARGWIALTNGSPYQLPILGLASLRLAQLIKGRIKLERKIATACLAVRARLRLFGAEWTTEVL